MNSTPRKIIIGMSGGVDSAVSAHLLLQEGHAVEALFMKNWEEDDTSQYCSAARDLEDVDAVCQILGIPYRTVNFSTEYWERVFKYFLQEYKNGRTPNPDVVCNREIKFRAFLDWALATGADAIATGHYARLKTNDDGSRALLTGQDADKDQSYFLHQLNQHQLKHTLFPVGTLTKKEVRRRAAKLKLPNFAKKDSTGICFIGERPFKEFLKTYLPAQPGTIVTAEGQEIGRHEGLMYYTLGQRQGIGIGGYKGHRNEPWYVVDKDLPGNRLVVVQGAEHPLLYKSFLIARELYWVAGSAPAFPLRCMAKNRYRQEDQTCLVLATDTDQLRVEFSKPQRAVTPGQSIVFYSGEQCLGGGVIQS